MNLTAFLGRFISLGLLKISNFPELDIPVDVQVARFTFCTGTLRILTQSFQGCVHADPLRSLIQGIWRQAAKQANTHPWKLDEPMWTIGSSLCSKRGCSLCPVKDLCSKIRGFQFKDGDLIWKKPNDSKPRSMSSFASNIS